MKRLVSATLATALVSASAFAALAGVSEGVVAGVDLNARTVILQDGTAWQAGADVDLSQVEIGDTIQVTYDDGTMQLTAVEKVEM